ncbi:hypothetical protein PC117_g25789 [Phytophthora cactorum]|uniref:Uncharacterized protein n=1 Tax=Phytophthora cactorum TaxID=29920 RepID=A0A8T1AKB2_9STRA|nr:hypothetical protein PC117_g25789 [Phytophthora cactorum]
MGKGSGGGSGSKGGGSSSSGGSGSKGGSTGSSQAAADNRSNQMNPNNSAYYSSRAHGSHLSLPVEVRTKTKNRIMGKSAVALGEAQAQNRDRRGLKRWNRIKGAKGGGRHTSGSHSSNKQGGTSTASAMPKWVLDNRAKQLNPNSFRYRGEPKTQ